VFDLTTEAAWSDGANLPSYSLGGTLVNDEDGNLILAANGITDDIWRYNPATVWWDRVGALTAEARSGAAVAAVSDASLPGC